MPNVQIPVSTLIQGVSQQAVSQRNQSQAESQDNFYPSHIDGLVKRHPLEHLALTVEDNSGDTLLHAINRDTVERYLVQASYNQLRVNGVDGTSYPVHGPTGPGYTPDFTYLGTKTTNLVTTPETFASWTVGADATTPALSPTVKGPFGEAFATLLGSLPGAAPGQYSLTMGTYVGSAQTFSCYFKQSTADAFSLGFVNSSEGEIYVGSYEWDAGTLVEVAVNPVLTVVTEDVGYGWYRISVTQIPDSNPTIEGHSRQVFLRIDDFDALASRHIYAWGAHLANLPVTEYLIEPTRAYRMLSIADFTFFLNRTVPVELAATVSAAANVRQGFAFVKAGNYETNYVLNLRTAATNHTVTVKTWLGSAPLDGWELKQPVTEDPTEGTIKTDDIAQNIVDQINSANPAADGVTNYSGNGIAAAGWSATRFGSVVKIVQASADITVLQASDSVGDSTFTTFLTEAESISSLPLICEHGKKLRIVGQTKNPADDFYIEFVADLGSGFGKGFWKEASGFAVETTLDEDTMPHVLVRRQDDASGTVTGVASQIYFEFAPATWDIRLVGDDLSNPAPSFVDNTLNDLVFYQDRLGFLSGQNHIYSQVSEYFNFWRTTVQTLPDDERLDLAAPHTSVSTLYHSVPFAEQLILFSQGTEFVVTGKPIRIDNVATQAVLEIEALTVPSPLVLFNQLYFAAPRGEFSAVHGIAPNAASDVRLLSEEVTSAVPRYIPGNVFQMTGSAQENCLLFLQDSDRGVLYGYKFFDAGTERLQSAWFKYTLLEEPNAIRGVVFIGSTAYFLLQRPEGAFLEKMQMGSGRVDPNSDRITYLDRRLTALQVTASYNALTNETTFTLPYDMDDGEYIILDTDGQRFEIQSSTTTTLVVFGDKTDTDVYIGKLYRSVYRPSPPVMRQEIGRGKTAILEGRLQVYQGQISYRDSSEFSVEVTPQGRTTLTKDFDAQNVGGPVLIGTLAKHTGVFSFGVLSRADQFTVDIVNDGPYPSNLQSMAWLCDFTSKTTVVG